MYKPQKRSVLEFMNGIRRHGTGNDRGQKFFCPFSGSSSLSVKSFLCLDKPEQTGVLVIVILSGTLDLPAHLVEMSAIIFSRQFGFTESEEDPSTPIFWVGPVNRKGAKIDGQEYGFYSKERIETEASLSDHVKIVSFRTRF